MASRELALLNDDIITQILNAVADAAIAETHFILAENEKDIARMDKNDPKYDRLKLTEDRLKGIAADTRNVETLPSPLGKVLKESVRPNGMKLTKVSVPSVSYTHLACPMWVSLVENNESQDEGADYFIRKYIDQLL